MTPKPLPFILIGLIILRLFARRIILTLRRKRIINWPLIRIRQTIRATKIILTSIVCLGIILFLLKASVSAQFYFGLLPKSIEDKNIILVFEKEMNVYPDFLHCTTCTNLRRAPEDCEETLRKLMPNTHVKALKKQVNGHGIGCTEIALPEGGTGWIQYSVHTLYQRKSDSGQHSHDQ